MSDNDDWRRERAAQLHGDTDWTIRPAASSATAPAADVLPMRLAPAAPGGSSAVRGDDRAPTIAPRAVAAPDPLPAPVADTPRSRLGVLAAALLALVAAAVGWLVFGRVAPADGGAAPATSVRIAAAPAVAAPTAPTPVRRVSRCADPLAAAALSAAIRSGTAFAGESAAPATLDSVVETGADGATTTCHAILQLQIADRRAGLAAMQIVSGPVDYGVDAGPVAGAPVFRVLRAPSIVRRLAMMPAPPAAAPPAAAPRYATPSAPAPAPAVAATPRPTTVAPPPVAVVRPPVVEPVEPAAPVPVPAPATPRRAEAFDVTPTLQATVPLDDRAAASDAARTLYGAIRRSGDVEAIEAADEGRDLYLRRAGRCRQPACTARAYGIWLAQLRYISDRGGVAAH